MAIDRGPGSGDAPESIFIQPENLPKKEPHHCQFGDCTKPRRGYHKFCKEHKAIGRIISGKIAREEANAKIAARNKLSEVTETSPRISTLGISYPSLPNSNSSSINLNLKEDNTFFFGAAIFFILLSMLFVGDASSKTPEDIYWAGCMAAPIGCLMIGSAFKDPITKLIVMAFLIPITGFLMFYLFIAAISSTMDGGGGCFGVCGLSGWGGP